MGKKSCAAKFFPKKRLKSLKIKALEAIGILKMILWSIGKTESLEIVLYVTRFCSKLSKSHFVLYITQKFSFLKKIVIIY